MKVSNREYSYFVFNDLELFIKLIRYQQVGI